jgi:deoxyribose-phosphate aldolase
VINVILETAVLTRANADDVAATFAASCRAAREGACDGVVTSTGFHATGGATADAVKLIREIADGLTVTAVAAVDTAENAAELLRAGADAVWSERAGAIVVEWARG